MLKLLKEAISVKSKSVKKAEIRRVSIDSIIRDDVIDERGEAEAMRYGLLSPPLICREGKNYRLLRGGGAVSVAEEAGEEKIVCAVVSGISEAAKEALALSEEFYRLSPAEAGEKADGFMKRNGLGEKEAAAALFVTESFLKSRLSACEASPENRVRRAAARRNQTVKAAFRDYRIFKNTIDKTVEKIRLFGVKAVADAKEEKDGLEYIIRLTKE